MNVSFIQNVINSITKILINTNSCTFECLEQSESQVLLYMVQVTK